MKSGEDCGDAELKKSFAEAFTLAECIYDQYSISYAAAKSFWLEATHLYRGDVVFRACKILQAVNDIASIKFDTGVSIEVPRARLIPMERK